MRPCRCEVRSTLFAEIRNIRFFGSHPPIASVWVVTPAEGTGVRFTFLTRLTPKRRISLTIVRPTARMFDDQRMLFLVYVSSGSMTFHQGMIYIRYPVQDPLHHI